MTIFIIRATSWKYVKRVPFFQLKVYETGIFSVKMVYKRVRGRALGGGGSLPVWNFVEYPPEPTSSKSIIKNHSFSYKLLIRTVQSLAYPHSLLWESQTGYKRVHVRNVIYVEVSASQSSLYARNTKKQRWRTLKGNLTCCSVIIKHMVTQSCMCSALKTDWQDFERLLRNHCAPYVPRMRDHFGIKNDLLGQPFSVFLRLSLTY